MASHLQGSALSVAVFFLALWLVPFGTFTRFPLPRFLGFSNFTSSDTAGWAAANRSLNFLFTVRSGTTRVRHRTMAEFASARSGNGQTDAFPLCCWAEPSTNQRQKSRNLSGDISVYLTVCWMFLCPR
jgi:hypothetical protein